MNTNFSLATPATNRFETILADFVSTPSGYYADVKIVTVRNVPSITKSGLLEQALTHSISGLADQIIEPVDIRWMEIKPAASSTHTQYSQH
jgi:hypothetical protein